MNWSCNKINAKVALGSFSQCFSSSFLAFSTCKDKGVQKRSFSPLLKQGLMQDRTVYTKIVSLTPHATLSLHKMRCTSIALKERLNPIPNFFASLTVSFACFQGPLCGGRRPLARETSMTSMVPVIHQPTASSWWNYGGHIRNPSHFLSWFQIPVMSKLCRFSIDYYVIDQQRGRVFHQGIQTPRHRWKHEAAGWVLLLFRGVWIPWWNTKPKLLIWLLSRA